MTFFIISASMNGWMLYAPLMRLTPGYNSRPTSTNTKPWKGISGFSSGCYTQKHTKDMCTGCDHTGSGWTDKKCSSQSSHQLVVSGLLPHYLQRPQSVVKDLLTQPEIGVNSDKKASFTFCRNRVLSVCTCVYARACVQLTWLYLRHPGSTLTLCPSSLEASSSPTHCGNLGPAGRITASDGGLTS